jgi:hypothetical protein
MDAPERPTAKAIQLPIVGAISGAMKAKSCACIQLHIRRAIFLADARENAMCARENRALTLQSAISTMKTGHRRGHLPVSNR